MEKQKIYEMTVNMIRKYDNETDHCFAESIIADPARFAKQFPEYFFYHDAAVILAGLQEDLYREKSGSDAPSIPAIKRILKNGSIGNREELSGMFEKDGKFCICNGYIVLRYTEDIPAVPHPDKPVTFDIEKIISLTPKGRKMTVPGKGELKAWIAAHKPEKKQGQPPMEITDGIWINPKFLLDVMEAMPGAEFFYPVNSKSPIYFRSGENDGVILPVMPPKKSEKAA